jgi:hypothetical protein
MNGFPHSKQVLRFIPCASDILDTVLLVTEAKILVQCYPGVFQFQYRTWPGYWLTLTDICRGFPQFIQYISVITVK